MEKDTELNKTIQTPTEDKKTQTEPILSELERVGGDNISVNTANKQPTGKPFEKNDPRINREGRPKGSKNFETLFWEGLKKVAELNGREAEDFEKEIMAKYVEQARKGDFRFLKDMYDRRFGQPIKRLDHTSDGERIEGIDVVFKRFDNGEQGRDTSK